MAAGRGKIIFHIDVNSAFLSWSAVEQLREGQKTVDLRTVPSIVCGDIRERRGIVTAASIPAKKRGVHSAQTVAEAFRLCPELVQVKSDFGLYRIRSRELMELLRTYSPILEQLSVDECFLDVTARADEREAAVALAHEIKDKVRDQLGYTVNIGVSTNKVLAKMASDFEKPDRVHTLFPDEIQTKIWPLPVGELFMAGKASAAKLQALGIRTIGELAASDPDILESHLKSHGRTLWEYANGVAGDEVHAEREAAKSESVERTLKHDCIDLDDAFGHIRRLCDELASRLYNHGYRAGEVAIIIKYADFTSATHQRRVISAVTEAAELEQEARALFEEAWDGRPVRLLGVRAGKLQGLEEPVQLSLTDYAKEQSAGSRRKKADDAMKDLRERYGDDIIYRGKR